MKIRTVTVFDGPGFPVDEACIARAGRAATAIKAALEADGYDVQTIRFALPPFAALVGGDPRRVVDLARQLERGCAAHAIDYATIGPARAADAPDLFRAIPDAIGTTERVFASALIADTAGGLHLPAIRLAAEVIHRAAALAPDGFGNLRFAALANVPPGVPYFPAAYHDGGTASVAVGLEAADLAVSAAAEARSLREAGERLTTLVERETRQVMDAVRRSCPREVRVSGIDCSLAPFPDAARSIGTALEGLSGGRLGERGTLAAVACIADALDRAKVERAGYSGIFLPVLEDAVLAARAADEGLSLTDLLLWASVCGTGLDTVPLPGDISVDAVAAVLLDVAALALRLDKPLSARLMPIPGRRAGDPVAFDFPYFASSRVLEPRAPGLGGLFTGSGTVPLGPRVSSASRGRRC
jgi:uncharacterized protein (UPF0210 family)